MTRPPTSLTLAEEEQRFYAALGKAIAQWQGIEEGLALIFCGVVTDDITQSARANAGFHTVLNFETKLGMTDSALAMSQVGWVPEYPTQKNPVIEDWRPLNNRCGRRAKRRNELAHFAIEVDETRPAGYRYFLTPNIINLRSRMLSAGQPAQRNPCKITATGNSFEKLGLQLKGFCLRRIFPRRRLTPPAASP